MAKGRKKKPTALKKLQGTLRKDRVNDDMPEFPIVLNGDVNPVFVNDYAEAEWNRVFDTCTDAGLLTTVDLSALAMYCNEIGIYWQMMDQIKETGPVIFEDGIAKRSPATMIANNALKNAMGISVQFGFTPSSREKVKIIRPAENDKPDFDI